MQDELLNVACGRILEKIEAVIKRKEISTHETYLKLWEIMKNEDEKIADMFNDIRRSNAVYKLTRWKHNSLITDEELTRFSDETKESIRGLEQIWKT